MKKRIWTKIFIGIYVMLAVLCFTGFGILENLGYAVQKPFSLMKYGLLCLAAVYIWCVGRDNLRRYKVRYPDRSIQGGKKLLLLYTVAAVAVLSSLGAKNDGVRALKWKMYAARVQASQEIREEQRTPSEVYKKPENRVYGKVEDAYQKLYEEALALSYPNSETGYNAKGNFYALLEEGTGEYGGQQDVPYRITIVYDRISDDGNAQMFNHYKIYSTESGDVTDFGLRYCVDMDSGAITAEEVPWGN